MQKMTVVAAASRPQWDTLETFARAHVRAFIQQLLEDEVTELLGREKSARRAAVDAPVGARNGHGQPRRLALMNGTITVRRPRVRDLEERFVSRLLPLFQRRTPEVAALLPELYLHGLALGGFELALRGLLGKGAPLSASSLVRLKATWQARSTRRGSRAISPTAGCGVPLGRRRVREGRARHRQGRAAGASRVRPPRARRRRSATGSRGRMGGRTPRP